LTRTSSSRTIEAWSERLRENPHPLLTQRMGHPTAPTKLTWPWPVLQMGSRSPRNRAGHSMLCPYEPNAGPRDDAGAEAPFNLGRGFAGLPFGLLPSFVRASRVKRPAIPHKKSAGLKDPALRSNHKGNLPRYFRRLPRFAFRYFAVTLSARGGGETADSSHHPNGGWARNDT
jgi:hypothetical protein